MNCRFCNHQLEQEFIDLVNAPPSNAYLKSDQLTQPEPYYPLKIFVCPQCFLVQIAEYKRHDEIFSADYAYFSSFSRSWLAHCQRYVEMIIPRLKLNRHAFVVEIASNDGYLLQYFSQRNIPCLGIEPTAGTAAAARKKGIETLEAFFGMDLAEKVSGERGKADLIIGNNVLAHVPDIRDFVGGLQQLLAPGGTITMEFPHLLNLIRFNQFDTIYHEHFSYLSLFSVRRIFAEFGLTLYDVEELPTHGGSLRIYARHTDSTTPALQPAVEALEQKERQAGLDQIGGYTGLQQAADAIRNSLLLFLLDCRQKGKKVAAYGAAAKGNTLLNYCGIKGTGLIQFVVDASPHKQGRYLPGSHIPVVEEAILRREQPDYILILPWNLREEISEQLTYARNWGAHFVTAIPELQVD